MPDHAPEPSLSISQRAITNMRSNIQSEYLQALNAEQREAVEHLEGPLLVLAGAGTGKTRVLTTRLAHILACQKAKPWQILTVTFTNKAAREMRERAGGLIGDMVESVRWLGTFHSISALILRQHAELVELKSSFTILDTDDQIRLCKQIILAEGIDPKRWTPRYLAGLIDSWKNRALSPDKVSHDEAYAFAEGRGAKCYEIYQARLKILNSCDFGDLIMHCVHIFQNHPDILASFHDKFRYILVDEYQDTNVAQYLWLRLLAQGTQNLCCVGDDDQSIYGWRGAEVDNILRFERDFPGAKIIRLERNYRSKGHILAAASKLITSNQSRLGKTLWTEDEQGEPVKVRGVWDGEAEARLIGDDIEAWRTSKRQYDECAVLVRASWQMRAFEERFIMLGIPYRVIGGARFFERAEIRDALAYLRLLRQTSDDLAFERIINQPKRGIGQTSMQSIQIHAREANLSLFESATNMLAGNSLKGSAKRGMKIFLTQLQDWRTKVANIAHTELAEIILDESGYTDMLRNDRSVQAQTRLDNLKELIRAMGEFDSLAGFLEHVELVMDVSAQAEGDAVQILTLHSAKGLEWPMVFLPGWEEEVFPSRKSLDEQGAKGLEEERRLAYVGLTRAREQAYISFAANRMIYGRWQSVLPSRFVDELPPEAVDVVSETGYSSQFTQGSGGTFHQNSGSDVEDTHMGGYDSPGWRRFQANQYQPNAHTKMSGASTSDTYTAPGKFQTGMRIFHIKFGYGQIVDIEGDKLGIEFDKAGSKKVLSAFIEKV